jgi:hypothetical protein
MAAGTLPRAIDVKAIAEVTVAGSAHRRSNPRARSNGKKRDASGDSSSPTSGKTTNVARTTNAWRRTCATPARMASRESLAPWRKNKRAIAAFASHPSAVAASPLTGNTLARATVPRSASVKRSTIGNP